MNGTSYGPNMNALPIFLSSLEGFRPPFFPSGWNSSRSPVPTLPLNRVKVFHPIKKDIRGTWDHSSFVIGYWQRPLRCHSIRALFILSVAYNTLLHRVAYTFTVKEKLLAKMASSIKGRSTRKPKGKLFQYN